jgi:hypothetical protein
MIETRGADPDQSSPEQEVVGLPARIERIAALPDTIPNTHIVVIRSSSGRWLRWLWLPTLCGLTALAFFSYRLHAPDWIGILAGNHVRAGTPSPSAGSPTVASTSPIAAAEAPLPPAPEEKPPAPVGRASEPVQAAPKVQVKAQPRPEPEKPAERVVEIDTKSVPTAGAEPRAGPGRTSRADSKPIDEPPTSFEELARSVGMQLPLPPKPKLGGSAQGALDDIRAESDRIKQERTELVDLKQDQLAQDDAETFAKREEAERQRRMGDYERRVTFRGRLRALLTETPGKPAPAKATAIAGILEAARESGAGPSGRMLTRLAKGSPPLSRSSKRARVAELREQGHSEPVILFELARLEYTNVGARNGPKDGDDALLRAARILLSVPLPPNKYGPAPEPDQDRR